MSKFVKSLIVSTFVIALGAPAIASADAQSDLLGTGVKVSYADLDLQKSAGAQVLYRRLQNAARQACGAPSLRIQGSLRTLSETKSCYRKSLDAAVAKVDNARVNGIHAS